MKNNIAILFKILLINQLKINEIKEKKSKQRRNTILVGIAMIALVIMLASYSFGIGFGLGSLGIGHVIPGYGISIVSIITLFFTIFKSNGTIFGFKDYEMLVSLPIKTSTIIASRFLHMYLMNTIFAAIVMIPLGVAYCIFEKPAGLFYLIWVCGILLATLIPTTIAAAIGAIIVYVASHFKYTNVCVTVLSFILVIGIIGSSLFMGNVETNTLDINQLSNLGEMISEQSNTMYPISSIFEKAVVEYNIGAFLLFIVISLGWYLLYLKLLTLKYKSINTAIMTHSSKSNYKMQELKTSSALGALYKKELKRFFSSNIYVLNVGMGAIMAFVMTIAIFVLEPSKMEEMMQIPSLDVILVKVIPFVFSAVIAMSCTTSVALSLEGKNLWILKSLPINTKTILNSKIFVNLTITVPIALLFGVLMNIKFQPDIVTRMMLIITPIIYSIFVAVWGMFINIKMPNFEWESETAVIKQGMSSMIGMLGGAVFAVIPILAIIFLTNLTYQMINVVATVIFGLISVLLYRSISRYKI
jgi:ABC-2 type transport system permease protein